MPNLETLTWLNWLAIPTGLLGVLIVFLTVHTLIRDRLSSASLGFALMTAPVAVWLFSFAGMYLCTSLSDAYNWAKVGYLGVPLIPFGVHYFTRKVLHLNKPFHRTCTWVFLALSLACTAMLVATPAVFGKMHAYAWGFYPSYEWPNPATAAYLAVFFGIMLMSLAHYWIEFKKPQTEIHHKRIKCLFVAFAFGYFALIDFLPKFGVPMYPLGFTGVLWFVLVAAYVLRTYRLVDLTTSFAAEKIMGLMGDALVVVDRENIVRIANEAACQYLESKDVVGRPVDNLGLPIGVTLPKMPEDRVYENVDEKGRLFSVSESFVKDPMGEVMARVIVLRDVTSFKKTQADLAEAQIRYNELYNEAREPIFLLDEFGRFYSVNQQAETLFGTTEKSLNGKIFVMSDLLPSAFMSQVGAAIRKVMEGAKEDPFLLTLHKGGTDIHVRAQLSAVRQNGRIVAVQFLLKNLAEEERMELAVKKAKEEILDRLRAALNEAALQTDPEAILQKIRTAL